MKRGCRRIFEPQRKTLTEGWEKIIKYYETKL
jgi:hypothetical protein